MEEESKMRQGYIFAKIFDICAYSLLLPLSDNKLVVTRSVIEKAVTLRPSNENVKTLPKITRMLTVFVEYGILAHDA